MRVYEGYFVLPPEAALDVRKNQIKTVEGLIEKFKGKVQQKTELGRRPLGYPLKKFKEGYAVVLDFELDPSQHEALGHALALQEEVVKFMVTRKETPGRKAATSPPSRERTVKKQNPTQDQKVSVS